MVLLLLQVFQLEVDAKLYLYLSSAATLFNPREFLLRDLCIIKFCSFGGKILSSKQQATSLGPTKLRRQ
jgi:hypothetical protein